MVQNGKSFLVEGQCHSKKVHKVACYVETQKMLEMCSERVPWKKKMLLLVHARSLSPFFPPSLSLPVSLSLLPLSPSLPLFSFSLSLKKKVIGLMSIPVFSKRLKKLAFGGKELSMPLHYIRANASHLPERHIKEKGAGIPALPTLP